MPSTFLAADLTKKSFVHSRVEEAQVRVLAVLFEDGLVMRFFETDGMTVYVESAERRSRFVHDQFFAPSAILGCTRYALVQSREGVSAVA